MVSGHLYICVSYYKKCLKIKRKGSMEMLITRTPFRISFFGGGTDYYDYFSKYGGCVLSTTIDKYCYLSMRKLPPFFDYKNQFTYSKIERFDNAEEVKHPLVRAALKYMPRVYRLHMMPTCLLVPE